MGDFPLLTPSYNTTFHPLKFTILPRWLKGKDFKQVRSANGPQK